MIFYYSLFIMNIVSFFMCYNDKRRAIKHKKRISEKMLLTVSLCGGPFGFYVAMYVFRHKTRHLRFLILEPLFMMLWIVIILIERGML